MKLTEVFRLIFLAIVFGGSLTGCLPVTSDTVTADQIHAVSLSLQAKPTGNISAQFHILPKTVNTVTIQVVCTNNNPFPVSLTIKEGVAVSIYTSTGGLVEVVKNHYSSGNGYYKMVLEPGQDIQVETFTVSKPRGEQGVAYSEFSYSIDSETTTKLQAVTSVF